MPDGSRRRGNGGGAGDGVVHRTGDDRHGDGIGSDNCNGGRRDRRQDGTGESLGGGRALAWRGLTSRLRSIRVRITVAAIVVTAAVLALTGWLFTRSVEDTQLGRIRGETAATLDDVAALLEDDVEPAQALRDLEPAEFVQIIDGDGNIVAAAVGAISLDDCGSIEQEFDPADGAVTIVNACGYGQSASADDILAPNEATGATHEDAGDPGATAPGTDAVRGEITITDAVISVASEADVERLARGVQTASGELIVTADAPVDEVARSVEAVRRALYLAAPVLVTAAAALTWLLVGRALRPVESIRSEVEAIGGSTIDRRVPVPSAGDEIGRLATTMNAMLDRLDRSARRQREFVSDASHELRSPIASIRTNLEVALKEGDTARWSDVAREVLTDEARLERLLDDLLLLAVGDEGREPSTQVPVDVGVLVRDVASAPRRVPVTCDPASASSDDEAVQLMVTGDRHELRRVLTNLVDNAARHAQTRVTVATERTGDTVRIHVDDDGAGIAGPDRERIFERFVRLDEGRARDEGGTGLGLAVVASIVARHGGDVGVASSDLGGARFTVELPAAPW